MCKREKPNEMLNIKLNLLIFVLILSSSCIYAQYSDSIKYRENLYTYEQLETLLKKPDCLEGYFANQTGYLSKIDSTGKESFDTTFTILQLKIPSDDIFINGWLYLPLGEKKKPLVILTNGGGNITKNARSFSDWLAPILAHCGIAAFVHDKRGTGESGGVFTKTTYEDYIEDARSCAMFLSKHVRIDSSLIGIAGASEGGRIAIIAASRYPIFKFVISFAGTVVSSVDDRIYAQKGWLKSLNLSDSIFSEVLNLHEKSIMAWASNDTKEHEKVNEIIIEKRKKYDEEILPYTKKEMDSIPDFAFVLSTWYSLQYDYLPELANLKKKWLAIFGEEDNVVPTEASVKNIIYYMTLNGNTDYNVAVIPDCGHVPINTKTKRLIRLDNLMINWINNNLLNEK